MNDYIAFLTGWAADIRASSGANSADADCLESIGYPTFGVGNSVQHTCSQIPLKG